MPDMMLVFTGVVAAAAVVQVIAVFMQYGAMQSTLTETRKSADAAKNSADAAIHAVDAERAYLTATEGTAQTPILGTETLIDVFLKIENFGRTPVFRARVAMAVAHKIPGDHPDYSRLEWFWHIFSIGANQPVTIPYHDLNLEGDRVRGRWIYGLIRYEDITGAPRSSGFAFILAGHGDGFKLNPILHAASYWCMDEPADFAFDMTYRNEEEDTQ